MPKLKVNDIELYYEEHGQGRPMVFLSETACDDEVWKINQIPEFSKDHRVITFVMLFAVSGSSQSAEQKGYVVGTVTFKNKD